MTKIDIIGEIVTWSSNLPKWQSDALRRLFQQSSLTEADIQELTILAKAEADLEIWKTALIPLPLQRSQVPILPELNEEPTLCCLRDVKNVNALAEGQQLRFGEKGLTVVYGENATGKSGYCRVLKNACKARDAEKIKPNVFSLEILVKKPSATFDIKRKTDSESEEISWTEGDANDQVFNHFAVFDSKCARVILEQENRLTYEPYGLDIFKPFLNALVSVESRLNAEANQLEIQPEILKELSGEHEVGKLISKLPRQVDSQKMSKLSVLTEEESAELATLKKSIGSNPIELARQKKRMKSRLQTLRQKLLDQKEYFESEALEKLLASKQDYETKIKAAARAASPPAEEPLNGVGENEWVLLYKAAEKYSIMYAYPELGFPVTDKGSRCPLCMQFLDEEARERLSRFRNYMQDETRKQAVEAKKLLDQSIEEKNKAPSLDIDQQTLDELGEVRPSLKENVSKLEGVITSAANWVKQLKENRIDEIFAKPQADFTAMVELEHLASELEKQAENLQKPDQVEFYSKQQQRIAELEVRQKLFQNYSLVEEYLNKIRKASKLRQIVTPSVKKAITAKCTDLNNRVVGEKLQTALNNELASLGMTNYKFVFHERGLEASTVRRLVLCDVTTDAKMLDVLSEGEQKVVSIAAFLAELGLTEANTSIIFDDPVTSLDYSYMNAVAKRLAKESSNRQVIIFTHNISFYFGLMRHATIANISLQGQAVLCKKNKPGYCEDEGPWNAKSPKEKIKHLHLLTSDARKAYVKSGSNEYENLCDEFYLRLRDTWEMVIEREVLNEVIRRFEIDVATKRLNSVVVDTEIYRDVFHGMADCSELMHNCPAEYPPIRKTPNDMESAIKQLEEFRTALKEKQKVAKSERSATEMPPKIKVTTE